MNAVDNKAVNIKKGILDRLLVILEITVKDLLGHPFLILFTHYITGWTVFVIRITLNQKEKELHFICHHISLLR